MWMAILWYEYIYLGNAGCRRPYSGMNIFIWGMQDVDGHPVV